MGYFFHSQKQILFPYNPHHVPFKHLAFYGFGNIIIYIGIQKLLPVILHCIGSDGDNRALLVWALLSASRIALAASNPSITVIFRMIGQNLA